MISWCRSLKSATESNSKWKASISFSSSNARILNQAIYRNTSFRSLSRSSSSSSICSTFGTNVDDITTSNVSIDTSFNHDINDLSAPNNVIFEHKTFENNCLNVNNIDINNLSTANIESNYNSDDISNSSQSTYHSQSKFDTKLSVDILELMGDDNNELLSILTSIAVVNLYPKNAIFLFEGYVGKESKDDLINEIKSSAFKTGTVLSMHKMNSSQSRLNAIIGCIHYGASKKTLTNRRKKFDPNLVQACNTIIQFAHDPPSVKNKSKNSFNKRTTSSMTEETVSDSDSSKVNRSSSKKCFVLLILLFLFVIFQRNGFS